MLLIESLLFQFLAIAIGACIGSFLNVVIYRIPAKISILHPPSRCPHCLRKLAPRDNLPIIGWFLIKGKCRYCHAPVSWRYPAIEALTAFLFWCVSVYFAPSQSALVLGFYALFLSWLLALAMIDFDTQTLPNSLTQSGLVCGLIYQGSLAFINSVHSGDRTNFVRYFAGYLINAIIGGMIGIWLLDIIRLVGSFAFQKEAMGGGDPKLMAMIGVWLSWQKVFLVIIFASAIGTIVGLLGIAIGKLRWSKPIPFGVFLAISAAVSLFWGDIIISGYLNIFGLSS